MKIVAHILTCPERAAVLRNTLASLRASDWVAEPHIVEHRQDHPNQKVWFLRGTHAVLERAIASDTDFILFLEDDLVFNRHLRANLERWAPLRAASADAPFFASLFRPPGVPLEQHSDNVALLPASCAFGTHPFIVSRATARYILDHWDEEVVEIHHRLAQLAGRLGPIYLHTPSLVQYVGAKSAHGGTFLPSADFSPTWKSGDSAVAWGPLTATNALMEMESFVAQIPCCPGGFSGTGVVIAAGGLGYLVNAWVAARMLRKRGCQLPIQIWHLGPEEMPEHLHRLFRAEDVECIDAHALFAVHPVRQLRGWALKPYAILTSRFRHVLLLDADNMPVVDPAFLFDSAPYRATGAIFWPDRHEGAGLPGSLLSANHPIWRLCDLQYRGDPSFESGQICVDKVRCWRELRLALWMNEHADFWYRFLYGDKDTFQVAWRKLDTPWSMPAQRPLMPDHRVFSQVDFDGRVIFQHRFGDKWRLDGANAYIPTFADEDQCRLEVAELRRLLFSNLGIGRDHVPRLTAGRWLWNRQGHSPRVISFKSDGCVDAGNAKAARLWQTKAGNLLLLGDDLTVTGQFRYVARAEAWFGLGGGGSSLVRVA